MVPGVAPGPVATDLLDRFTGQSAERLAALAAGVPFKRIGNPQEIANVIVFLASEKASFLTGQIVAVNGGKTAF
jgi:NAD(P)-dependent dehydrogenase (short-subunit alcohol dehydrogenase family)